MIDRRNICQLVNSHWLKKLNIEKKHDQRESIERKKKSFEGECKIRREEKEKFCWEKSWREEKEKFQSEDVKRGKENQKMYVYNFYPKFSILLNWTLESWVNAILNLNLNIYGHFYLAVDFCVKNH